MQEALDKVHAVPMRKQDAKNRAGNFGEVALGYTEEEAWLEAQRCLSCPKPKCIEGCPVELEIPAFIRLIKEKRYDEAIKRIREKNSLPAVCGRVCPQEEQCQRFCVRGIRGDPVSIGRLERFAADLERQKGISVSAMPKSTGKKVAIVEADRKSVV